ncbi:MAG: type II secretion system protein GspM [Myxococcota bacterium]
MNDFLARMRAAWDNLSSRERWLVIAVGASLGATLLWVAVLNPIAESTRQARSRTEDLEQQLEIMTRLRRDYDQVAGRLASVERRIAAGRETVGLRTLLSGLASRSAVKIDSMEERQSPDSDRYTETKLEVTLKNVSLGQTINYLHNIEAETRLLSVKSLRVRHAKRRSAATGDGEDLLDVTFTVSSFEPI